LDTIIAGIVNYNEELEELNRKQLRESRLADDRPISPDYSPHYAHFKRTFYPQSYADGKVNLYLFGDLYRSLEIKARGQEYLITTDVPYSLKLAKKYGQYTGIAPSNQPEAQRITGKKLADKYNEMVLK
jgi:hypothetical protein